MDGTSQAIFWRDADRRCDLSVGSDPHCPRPTSMVNPSYRDRDIPGRDAGYRRESLGTHASLQRDWHRASDQNESHAKGHCKHECATQPGIALKNGDTEN